MTRLPPGPSTWKALQRLEFLAARQRMVQRLTRRYGAAFTINAPIFGPAVIVTDPDLARQVLLAGPDDLSARRPNLSQLLGPGSTFALDGPEHRQRRNLLGPPFHGKNVRAYEEVFAEETQAEIAGWPDGKPFETLAPMLRITLNVILRTIFGAGGAEIDELRQMMLPMVRLGALLVMLPIPSPSSVLSRSRLTPWGWLAERRARYETIIDTLIDQARISGTGRADVLNWLLRSSYEDGTVMSRQDLGDELLGLLVAGHETTASTLAWTFERISRHPELLTALVAEADAGGNTLRRATIREVQRTRTVIDFAARRVQVPAFPLGEWVIPRGYAVLVAIDQIHRSAGVFPDPEWFDPHRYTGASGPSAFEWLPYGGGVRRCPGSTFANLEMDVVLRTVLQHLQIQPSTEPAEPPRPRGIAFKPKRGGRIVVHRRRP
ncbi:MAG TPA: cytochrome P450 [Mycobacterium sp.]|nr:cytochrome P450 [Mycobacterium sp.]